MQTNCVHPDLGYVHTGTFLHGFVLFHNPKGIPVYFQTIENAAKTLPCAHSHRGEVTAISSDSRPPKFEMLDINNCF